MKGLLKAIIDEKGNPAYPVSVADAIYVNAETTLADKLKEMETGLGVYVIDLERFGIEVGLPTKPYVLSDYEKANANITGINRALYWASTKGFTTVVLPKGEYSLCYPQQISLKSNMTFNLNGSKLKVMYDSDNRSPYWNAPETDPTWKFSGISFMFRDARNSHLMNGEIIGDMYDRSFKDPEEKWVEHTYGVSFSFSSAYNSVTHCKIHGFAGDNVNLSAGSTVRGGFNDGAILGDIDAKGVFTAGTVGKTTTMVTPVLTIPDGDFELWGISGQGYSRTTKLINKAIDVFYYTEKDEFIGVLTGQKVHTHITIPPKAKKYRMKFYGETDTKKNFDIFMDWSYHIHHNLIEYCELFNGHRGGITAGGSYNVIQNNMIRDNGKLNTFLDGAPAFPDPTRYGINQEDSYGNNNIIQNNVISGGFHGILSGVYSTFIRDNVFHSLSGSAVVIYTTQFASITGNYIESGGIYLSGTNLSSASVQITGNYIRGKVDVSNGSYRSVVRDNHIVDGSIVSNLYAHVEQNTIESTVQGGGFQITGPNFNNNLFLSGWSGNELIIRGNSTLKNNRFAGWLITLNETTLNAASTFKDCSFVACTIRNHTPNKQKVLFEECELTNTQLTPIALNTPQKMITYEVKNSKVLTTNLTSFVMPSVNVAGAATVLVQDTYFELRTDTLTSIFGATFEMIAGMYVTFKRNTIEYTGASASFQAKYFSKETLVSGPTYVVDNITKNMTMATLSYMIAKFDPDTTRKMWVKPDTEGKTTLVHNLGTTTPSLFFADADGNIVGPRVRIIDENTIEVSSLVAAEATIKR